MIVFTTARAVFSYYPSRKQTDSATTIAQGMPDNGRLCFKPCKQLYPSQQDTEIFTTDL